MTAARFGQNPAHYWQELQQDSYHRERAQAALSVHGGFAQALGLKGELTQEAFQNIFDGSSADRSRRVVHTTHERHPGLDLVFAPPKWFSALYALASVEGRRELEEILKAAVLEAMQTLRSEVAITRRGAGGRRSEHAQDIVFFLAIHPAGRLGQPHLHAHVLLPNVCLRSDGTTGTLDLTRVFESRRLLDTVFTEELALRLTQRFKLELRRSTHSYDLVVETSLAERFNKLLDQWSPGAKAIGEHLSAKNLPRTARSAELAQRKLRGTKTVVPYEQLFARWRTEAQGLGIPLEALQLQRRSTHELARAAPQRLSEEELQHLGTILSEAATQLTAMRNLFSERSFVRESIRIAHALHAPSHQLVSAAHHFLRESEEIVPLGESPHRTLFFTTRQRWNEEQLLLDLAKTTNEASAKPFAPQRAVEPLRRAERLHQITLDDTGREALYRLATSTSRLNALDASTGEDTYAVLRALTQLAHEGGLQVVAAAATAQQAAELERKTGITTQTVHQWLRQYERRMWEPPRDRRRELLTALFGKRLDPETILRVALERVTQVVTEALTGERHRPVLSSNTLFVIAGAQRLSVQELTQLLELNALSGGRGLLVGDASGLPALMHSGGFAALTESVPTARLRAPSRAQMPWLKTAQDEFEGRDHKRALTRVAEQGRLTVVDHDHDPLDRLIQDWRRFGVRRPAENLILTGSNADRHAANVLAQRERWRALRIAPLHFLTVGRYRIHQSDRVLLKHGLRIRGGFFHRKVRAGEFATVTHVDIVKRRITLKTDRGIEVSFDPKRFSNFIELGYSLTIARAETLRPKRAFTILGPGAHETLRASVLAAARDAHFYTRAETVGHALERLAQAASRRETERLATATQRTHVRHQQQRAQEQRQHQKPQR